MTDISRRDLFAAGAALPLGAALATLPTTAEAQAMPSKTTQAPGFYRYKVGDTIVTAINDGFGRRPLEGFIRNAELADVKRAMESAFLSTEQLTIAFTTIVLQTGGKTVLLDTGNGDSGAPTSGTWMANFRAAGFAPEDVDQVVISHFHGDHINGIRLKSGSVVFPRAEIAVPAAEWGFWMSDERMAAAPEGMKGGFQNARRVFGPIAADVKRYEAGAEVAPGVTAVAAPGHTPGHTAFVVASGAEKLMVMSDTTNHPALFVRNPDWSAVFDMDAEVARATRRKLLDMAASEKAQVAFYHAPFPATGHIARDGAGFQFVPASWTSTI